MMGSHVLRMVRVLRPLPFDNSGSWYPLGRRVFELQVALNDSLTHALQVASNDALTHGSGRLVT